MFNKIEYEDICNLGNLLLAWRKARKGKTKKDYVIEFEKNLERNLIDLYEELKNQTYNPKPLKTFILRDPKTRKISKSNFRDRVVHHALVRIIEPLFDKSFIYDNCANRKGKGNLFAIKRFDEFKRQVSRNNTRKCYCLKADIKHYFEEVDHEILMGIARRKISDERIIWLMEGIVKRERDASELLKKGMPLGNLTSQFFANVYLNELDRFVKHELKAKRYIRYVDDFVILHHSKEQLEIWKSKIDKFLREELKLELHPDKSKVIFLLKGVDFVGFRNFYHFRLLRKRNIRKMRIKISYFSKDKLSPNEMAEIFQGWSAYAKWANSFGLRKKFYFEISGNL